MEYRLGTCFEEELPFTKVNKSFECDRYGELQLAQIPRMDFYAQCPVNIKMTWMGDK